MAACCTAWIWQKQELLHRGLTDTLYLSRFPSNIPSSDETATCTPLCIQSTSSCCFNEQWHQGYSLTVPRTSADASPVPEHYSSRLHLSSLVTAWSLYYLKHHLQPMGTCWCVPNTVIFPCNLFSSHVTSPADFEWSQVDKAHTCHCTRIKNKKALSIDSGVSPTSSSSKSRTASIATLRNQTRTLDFNIRSQWERLDADARPHLEMMSTMHGPRKRLCVDTGSPDRHQSPTSESLDLTYRLGV